MNLSNRKSKKANKDILSKKRRDIQVEKIQISRILPELYFLLKKITNCKKKIIDFNSDLGSTGSIDLRTGKFYPDKLGDYHLKKWHSLANYTKEANELLRKIVSSRIFNIEKERKVIINEFVIEKIEEILSQKPRNKYDASEKASKLQELLDEVYDYFAELIKNYKNIIHESSC